MTDWLLPNEDELFIGGVLAELKDRDFDAASHFLNVPVNPITGMIRYLRASDKFQEYNGATWVDKVLSLAGGGTGAATAADARTNLGLGSIATQASNNVNITGGNLAGSGVGITNLNADNLASGTLPAARFPAVLPAVSGVNLTLLNASNLASGTVPDARFPAILPALNGSLLTNLNATALITGTVNQARLGSGGGGAVKFLREDNTWQDVSVVKSVQVVDDSWVAGGTGSTHDVALGTVLTNYLNASVSMPSTHHNAGVSAKLISNTTIRFTADQVSTGGLTLRVVAYITEYKNVG